MKTADNKVLLIVKTEYKFPIRQEYSATVFLEILISHRTFLQGFKKNLMS